MCILVSTSAALDIVPVIPRAEFRLLSGARLQNPKAFLDS